MVLLYENVSTGPFDEIIHASCCLFPWHPRQRGNLCNRTKLVYHSLVFLEGFCAVLAGNGVVVNLISMTFRETLYESVR